MFSDKLHMPEAGEAMPGRAKSMPVTEPHYVNGRILTPPYPKRMHKAMFGMGCFWGVERMFWSAPGVWVTAAGYSGGQTPNPTYQEACSGRTGHAEAVLVIHDPKQADYVELLKIFWENHDPTQGMRQGNDAGTQYRSAIYYFDEQQQAAAIASRDAYQHALYASGRGEISTEIRPAGEFYFAETYHQQYLARNPEGYCGVSGTGVTCPVGTGV